MATLNKVMLIGRVTDEPGEPRQLPGGGTVASFRFAVGRSRKNPQTGQWENDPNPLYIDCEAFGRPDDRRNLADVVAQYLKKGDQVYVEGRLQLDQWEDKNGGGKRSKHKVVVNGIEFLGGGAKGGDDAPAQDAPAKPAAAPAKAAPAKGGKGKKAAPADDDLDIGNESIPF